MGDGEGRAAPDHGAAAGLQAGLHIVVGAAAGGASRVQHHPHRDAARLGRDESHGNVIRREGEHLQADGFLGSVDEVKHRLATMLGLDDRTGCLNQGYIVSEFHAVPPTPP
jgi:hypothetical protein